MSPRYVAIHAADDYCWEQRPLLPAVQTDGERQPAETGLLDARGRKLYRLPEPVGFHRPGGAL